MATSNLNISVWRGSQVPPTNYHKWIKLDEEGNYLGQYIYRNGEWTSDSKELEEEIASVAEDINSTIDTVKQELQDNIDNLEQKHDSDKVALEELINNEQIRAEQAESDLNQKIDSEISRATNVEQTLDIKIDTETSRAQKAEEQLQFNINTTNETLNAHTTDINNPHQVTKEQVGLSNVTNDAQVKRSEMGQPNGVATLNSDGKIPSTQLDGQMAHVFGIDGVATSTTLPTEGLVEGDIYYTTDNKKFYNYNGTLWDEPMNPKDDTIYNFRNCDKDGDISRTNILYRWDGKDLVEISESLALGEVVGTAYEGNKGLENRNAIESLPDTIVSNIKGVGITTNNVNINFSVANREGLNYTESTDLQRTIPSASNQTAGVITANDYTLLNETIPNKLNEIDQYTINNHKISENPVLNGTDILLNNYVLGDSTEQVIPSDTINVAIGKLQLQVNTNKNQASQDLNEHIANKTNPHKVTKDQVGLGNVDNTSDLNKPISTATQEALDTKQPNLISGENIKTINGNNILGSGDIDFKTLDNQELSGSGNIPVKKIQDINGTQQSIFGTDPIITIQDPIDSKIYGRSNGAWVDLTPYLTWYIE